MLPGFGHSKVSSTGSTIKVTDISAGKMLMVSSGEKWTVRICCPVDRTTPSGGVYSNRPGISIRFALSISNGETRKGLQHAFR